MHLDDAFDDSEQAVGYRFTFHTASPLQLVIVTVCPSAWNMPPNNFIHVHNIMIIITCPLKGQMKQYFIDVIDHLFFLKHIFRVSFLDILYFV